MIFKLQTDSTGTKMMVYNVDQSVTAMGENYLDLPPLTRKFISGYIRKDGTLVILDENVPEQGW